MPNKSASKDDRTASIEAKLLEQYGGRGTNSLPQTLMFDHVSPATRLLEKRRQMFEVQEALNSQKEEFSRREDAFRRREEGLRRKDLELQESLIKFNKFLQENESKRNRALKRTAEERKQREQKERDIEKLEEQLQQRMEEEKELKRLVSQNLKYQDYLENVVQNMSKFFPEISDVLNRHKTLGETNLSLIEKHDNDEALSELKEKELKALKKLKDNQLLSKSNELAEMQQQLEDIKSTAAEVQLEMEQVTNSAAEKTKDLGQIVASVVNILERCEESFRIRHNKPHIDRSIDKISNLPLSEQSQKTRSKLDEIAMFMVDYKDIVLEYSSMTDFTPLSIPKVPRSNSNVNLTDEGTHSHLEEAASTKTPQNGAELTNAAASTHN